MALKVMSAVQKTFQVSKSNSSQNVYSAYYNGVRNCKSPRQYNRSKSQSITYAEQVAICRKRCQKRNFYYRSLTGSDNGAISDYLYDLLGHYFHLLQTCWTANSSSSASVLLFLTKTRWLEFLVVIVFVDSQLTSVKSLISTAECGQQRCLESRSPAAAGQVCNATYHSAIIQHR